MEDISLADFAADYDYSTGANVRPGGLLAGEDTHENETSQNSRCIAKDQHVNAAGDGAERRKDDLPPDDMLPEDDDSETNENTTSRSELLLKKGMGILRKRKSRAIIRYFSPKYQDEESRIKSMMLLFFPFRNEVSEVHSHQSIITKYLSVKDIVDRNQREFEPNPEFMDSLESHTFDDLSQDATPGETFEEEETTTAEEIADFLTKQGKIYDGGKIRLQEKTELATRINSL